MLALNGKVERKFIFHLNGLVRLGNMIFITDQLMVHCFFKDAFDTLLNDGNEKERKNAENDKSGEHDEDENKNDAYEK